MINCITETIDFEFDDYYIALILYLIIFTKYYVFLYITY